MKFGFVQFESKENAQKAIAEGPLNEMVLEISMVKPAYIKFAQSKDIRRKYLKL